MSTSNSYPAIKLSHGGSIPIIAYGLGTANFKRGSTEIDPAIIRDAKTAISAGFVHLDGAEAYGNEDELGTAIQESAVPRSQLFVTTKVNKNISSPKKAIVTSLAKLKTDYVDLYLIHCPFWDEKEVGITIEEAWKEMEEVYEKGQAKAIGVSNFSIPELERVAKIAKVQPALNQIEYNPYLQSPEIIEYHRKNNILTAAYGPLIPITKGAPGPLDNYIEELAKKYQKSTTQILLRWAIDNDAVAITTSSKEWRMKEALDVSGFKLDSEDIAEIAKIGAQKHVRVFWKKEYKD